MTNNKKRIEAFHFFSFKESCAEIPEGKVVHGDSPDFLVYTSKGILGIEHTRLFKEHKRDSIPMQAIEGRRDKILRKAMIICNNNQVFPARVEVVFNNKKRFRNSSLEILNFSYKEAEFISEELAKSIMEYYTQDINLKDELHSSELPCQIEGIERVRINSGMKFGKRVIETQLWLSIDCGWVREHCVNEIQGCIDEKNKKYDNYRNKCQDCWLLIVADRSSDSQCFEMNQATKQYSCASLFDTVFYFEIMTNELVRLKTKNISGAVQL
jgi:hypothetical protein